MIILTALNINMGDFTAPSHLYCCYSDRNSILQCFYPVTLKNLLLAFRDDGDNFCLQYLHTKTMDFKILPLTPFIAVVQLVIQFCNAFMKLYCYTITLKYIFLAFGDDHFILRYRHK